MKCANGYRVGKLFMFYRGAKELVHLLTRWASAEYSSVDNLCCYEHSLDLSWLDADTDRP